MKQKVYILTFITYACVHMMRMTYSFNKHNLETRFGFGDLFLGLLDAIMFIALSIGAFLRYSIINNKQITTICLKSAILACIAFSIPPMVSLLKKQQNPSNPSFENYLIVFLSMAVFGFSQFSFFPALLTIFSRFYSVDKQGSLVGFWSSKANAGNIMGFFVSNFLVYQLHLKWEVTMLISSIALISVSLLMERLVQNVEDQSQKITTQQLFRFIKEKYKNLEFKLYILSFSFFKAILYSYELWTPQFLVDVGFANFSGYVPMVFDISTLVGSFLMGKLYENNQSNSEHKNISENLKSYKFFISSIFILLAAILYLLAPPSIYLYFSLAILMGMFLGGVYNSLQNSEILSYTKNNPRQTDLLSTVNIGLGCFLVGIFQLLIGFVIHFSSKNQNDRVKTHHNHRMIYVVIAVLAVVAMILTFFRTYHSRKEKQEFQKVQNRQLNDDGELQKN